MASARLVDGCGVEEVEHCVVGDLKRQPGMGLVSADATAA
jgi:hypothetical protein